MKVAERSDLAENKRRRRLEACPTLYRANLARCYAKKSSPRTAIKAFCLECVGYDRIAVTECTAFACPIWEYRPIFKVKPQDDQI